MIRVHHHTYRIIHMAGQDDEGEVVASKEISNKGEEDLRAKNESRYYLLLSWLVLHAQLTLMFHALVYPIAGDD